MKFHKSDSTRLQTWDYANNGNYFITICTQNKKRYFGKVINKEMQLSPIGEIAKQCWEEIPQHAKFTSLGEFCIMPDHIHGIITINNPGKKSNQPRLTKTDQRFTNHINQNNVDGPVKNYYSEISPKPDSLKTIIRSYKSAVSKLVRRAGYEFSWQKKYYDHIIRDQQAYKNIEKYIHDNPKKWG